ncbi:pyruvate kinase [Candidatus Sumerlaeota bacterium]|nr:pyruvate kinase [Candidatus Sumerlaeota bacterium]
MIINNRAKIVATLGPASMALETIRALVEAGVDVFRMNFSHGSYEQHAQAIRWVRQVSEEQRIPIAILGDLCGPKLRIGEVAGGEYAVKFGDEIALTSDVADGSGGLFQINVEEFAELANPGERILIDDGQIEFEILRVEGSKVVCRVLNSGVIRPHKGVNLPDTTLPIPALTEKDRRDMQFAIEQGVDLLALSFVRSADDIRLARDAADSYGGAEIPILAKIEKAEAVDAIEPILEAADGAMVARGDLGIEIPVELVPAAQKRIIRLCNFAAKPVITATQMLDSMIRNPRPTRAEATDVFNAIQDGTDAVMLSGETAIGLYPVETVQMMQRLASESERLYHLNGRKEMLLRGKGGPPVTQSICHAAVEMAEELQLDCIIAPTCSGHTARHISQFRPMAPVIAYSMHQRTVHQLCLSWGVSARIMEPVRPDEAERSQADALIKAVLRSAKKQGFIKPGNRAVVLGGLPFDQPQITNFLRVIDIH